MTDRILCVIALAISILALVLRIAGRMGWF